MTMQINNTATPRFLNASLYASLILIFTWFGGMKFTAYEAEAIAGLVSNSPLLAWTYSLFSQQTVAILIGITELVIAALLSARLFSPKLSALGAIAAAVTFVVTASLLLSTPGVVESGLGFPAITVVPGQFLLKDLGLFALSLLLFYESRSAMK